jgi:hypothetical protein
MLGLWGMSEEIVKVAAMHHHPLRAGDTTFSPLTAVHVANVLEYEGTAEPDGLPLPQLDAEYLKQLGLEERVELWRAARRDPEEAAIEGRVQRAKARRPEGATTIETKAQRAKVKRSVDATTIETKAQRARSIAKAASKSAESAAAPAAPANKFSPVEALKEPAFLRGAWKWVGIGLGATAALVLLARLELMRLESQVEKPGDQKVAANPSLPVKHDVAAVAAPPKPVEAKPAPAPATNTVVASATPTAPGPAQASTQSPAPVPAPTPAKTALDKLKLQGIFYSSHPVAMINGQQVGVDEEVSKCRVLEISESSVTLEYLNERKTLTLR